MKVVTNITGSGFHLSPEAIELFAELEGLEITKVESPFFRDYYLYMIYENGHEINVNAMIRDNHEYRTNENLVKIVEELGQAANFEGSYLKVVEIPDDAEFYIANEDDGEEIRF